MPILTLVFYTGALAVAALFWIASLLVARKILQVDI